ncbi:MAG: radical SAM protein [Bacillota bacterium]|nr:radical SAM protein [Bacillota bacterium]
MISVSRLLCDTSGYGDGLRYVPSARSQVAGTHAGAGPVVVWNVTPACNLRCSHCYYDAIPVPRAVGAGELPFRREGPSARGGAPAPQGVPGTEEALDLIDDLARFRVPVVLFSGGEPLLRPDLDRLIGRAVGLGIRTVISTNGTLITRERAGRLRELGVSYVGVSLDGIGEANDRMRGVPGAFEAALEGIRNCLAVGQRVGLRFTMTRQNVGDLGAIFDLIETEGIPRACFYHLVYSGRGVAMMEQDLSPAERRQALDLIVERTLGMHAAGRPAEILTVDNHADGPYLYLWALRHRPQVAPRVLELLRRSGGNRSGIAIAAIDHLGDVYPDQFSRHQPVGNVRQRPFSEIWGQSDHPVLRGLRQRKALLQGRCRRCVWLDVCNGNFRARAGAAGDMWGDDPACYLSDDEIAWSGGEEQWTA